MAAVVTAAAAVDAAGVMAAAAAVAMIARRAGNQRIISSFWSAATPLHSNQVQSGLFQGGGRSCCVKSQHPALVFMPVKEPKVEKPTYAVGDRVDKFCARCQEE